MTIEPVYNCEIDPEGIIMSKPADGLKITTFNIHFEDKISNFTKDHCECIKSSVAFSESSMQVTLVTEKNNIDEFLIFSAYNDLKKIGSIKLRFKR